MKKHLLASAAVGAALLTAATPALAETSSTGSQTTTAEVPASLSATLPSTTIGLGSLTPGAPAVESSTQTMSVLSNLSWGATIAADRTHMGKYSAGAYVAGVSLTNPFQWRRTSQTATSYASVQTAPTGGNLLTAQAATGDTPVEVGVQFRQAASYADAPVVGPDAYRIAVTYTVAQGL